MSFDTNKFLKALKRLELRTLFNDELDPYWEQVASEVRSCTCRVIHEDQLQDPYCILEIVGSGTYIQMILCETNEWQLELRITQENGEYTHYYGIKEGCGYSNTISDMSLIIGAFKEFYNGIYQPKSVIWVVYDI